MALATIRERETLLELFKRFEIHPIVITCWKKEFLKRSSEISEPQAIDAAYEKGKEQFYAKIGYSIVKEELFLKRKKCRKY